jgi:serine/threonine-protein kinase
MWTEKFDRQITDIFAVQDEIARAVAKALNATLAGGADVKLVRNETADPEAHSLYLQGMYLWNRRTAPAIRQAIGLFEEATKRDPNYARARAGIGLAYVALTFYDNADVDSLLTLARASAQRALAADSSLTEAWTAAAFADAIQWKNADADRGFARALMADSTFASAHFWNGLFLMHTARMTEARHELLLASELEPTSFVIQNGRGQLELTEGNFKAAQSILTRLLALDSTYAVGRYTLSVSYIEDGHFPDAIANLQALLLVPGVRSIEVRSALAEAYARSGRLQDAHRLIADIERTSNGHVTGSMASALMVLGEHDRAITTLRVALDQHDPWIINLSRSARYKELRADPVGGQLLARTESH